MSRPSLPCKCFSLSLAIDYFGRAPLPSSCMEIEGFLELGSRSKQGVSLDRVVADFVNSNQPRQHDSIVQ